MPQRKGLNPDPSFSEQLAKYYTEADLDAIPQEVLEHTRQVIVDFLGCAIGGADVDTTKQIKKIFLDTPGDCTVFNGCKAPVERAAFINGSSAHALEMDDGVFEAGGHAGVAIIPTALAMAEKENATGLDFMRAVILGYDMMTRVGFGEVPDNCFDRGWHPTATNGIFGAVAAAAYLMKLPAKQWANAWGIAYGFSSGNLECYADASMTKRLNPAICGQGAINAVRLAATGYTGPRWCFEGKHGFFTAFTDDPTPEKMLDKLDYSEYFIMRSNMKAYACCRYNHAAIDSIIKLMKENDIKPENVEKIVIDVCSMAIRAVVEPRELKYNPDNVAGAQFSLPYTAACAALYGDNSVQQFTEEAIQRPELKEFIRKIEMIYTGEMDQYLPTMASTAEIFTKDGKSYKDLTKYAKGDPKNRMTKEELRDKFIATATLTISKERAEEIYATIMRLETLTDIHELTRLF